MSAMNFIVCLLVFGFACVGYPKSPQISLLPIVSEQEELTARCITPLPKNLKNNVVESMTRDEITSILGAEHESFGSGVSYLVWYFDDHTCLTIFYLNALHDSEKEFFWLPCEPGKWTFDILPWHQKSKGPDIRGVGDSPLRC